MIFLDELKDTFLYKRPFFIPINEKDKRRGSAIFLLSPNVDTSIKMMNMPYVVNKNYFTSYYLERDVSFIINEDCSISNRIDNEPNVDLITETYLSAEEKNNMPESDFGLPEKKKISDA